MKTEQTNTTTGIEKFESNPVIQKLNSNVLAVIGSDKVLGFTKAYLIAEAVGELKKLLNAEYMKPIMQLQGSRLGFKTDKDKEGGYPENLVKDCLIDAVLSGVQPFGNQFNIIAGHMYITKEGFGYLLNNMQGLSYEITFELPRISTGADKSSAAIVAIIKWTIGGNTKEQRMDIPVKVNSFMGTDAVIGKATRKARAWLFNTIAGTEFGDGDITDINAEIMDKGNGNGKAVDFETVSMLYEMKNESLTPDEQINAERILGLDKAGKPEPLSFGKLFRQLQEK
jgi:hypothetical protein